MADLVEMLDRTARLVQTDFYPGLTRAEIAASLGMLRVEIRADEDPARCGAGQAAIVAAAVLTVELGGAISLNLPDVPVIGSRPPLRGGRLEVALGAALEEIRPGAVDGSGNRDLVVLL